MSWFLAYLILLIIIILMFRVGFKKDATWKTRIKGWLLLILPIPLYLLITGYFTTYYQHVQDCKADSGLKVLIDPGKAAQVQLRSASGSSDESAAHHFLHEFYPRLKAVEAVGNSTESVTMPNQYFSYSVASMNTSDRSSNWQEKWKFNKTPLIVPSGDMFVISEHREYKKNVTKYEWRLVRNGQLYAKITNYIHKWRGIQYPDAIPSWSCWDGYSEKYAYPKDDLIKLILK